MLTSFSTALAVSGFLVGSCTSVYCILQEMCMCMCLSVGFNAILSTMARKCLIWIVVVAGVCVFNLTHSLTHSFPHRFNTLFHSLLWRACA